MTENYNLTEKSKEELEEIINKLLKKLPEKSRIEFVSQWISPQAALSEAYEGDSKNFIMEVERFCKDCLDRKYYVDPDDEDYEDYEDYNHNYNNYTDYNETVDFASSVWAKEFEKLFRLAVMFSRNSEFEVSLKTFDRLFDCLKESEENEGILGTTEPATYIQVKWDLVFGEYYRSIAGVSTDKRQSAYKAVKVWTRGGNQYSESIVNYFTDIKFIEEAIRFYINECSERWTMQHKLYELLKSFYMKQDIEFDEIVMPESMLCYSQNFAYDVVQGYMSQQKWSDAVEMILAAFKAIDNEGILEALNIKLIDCYDELKQYEKALEVSVALFKKHLKKHDYYLKARKLASKIKKLDSFVKDMTEFVKSCDEYYSTEILLRILSFEGCTNDMVNVASKADGYSRHDYMKYTFKSLIYRALKDKDRNNISAELKELLCQLEDHKTPGIIDMANISHGPESERLLLQSAINILKDIIQFHIDAAKRTRYAKAAYYCSLVQEIYTYLNEKDEFERYYGSIVGRNTRRPALKDEMRKKIIIKT